MSEWQPIETAPKDANDILVYGHGAIRTAQWDRVLGKYRANVYAFVPLDPTHWMHLPEPPK